MALRTREPPVVARRVSDSVRDGVASSRAARTAVERLRQWTTRWRRNLALAAIEHPRGFDVAALDRAHRELVERLVLLRLIERAIDPSAAQLLDVVAAAPSTVPHSLFFQEAATHFGTTVAAVDSAAGVPPWSPVDETSPKALVQGLVRTLYDATAPVLSQRADETVGIVHEHGCATMLTVAHGAVTLEPRVSATRATGVYYSPSWAVEHLVEDALSAWRGREVGTASERTPSILDPACGAGAFLCGALRLLLRASSGCRSESRRAGSTAWVVDPAGERCLEISEKALILRQSIRGVDLDPVSVHRARMALLLTILDGESARAAARSEALESLLPKLDSQVKVGNALVEPGALAHRFGPAVELGAFAWEAEFPEVMRAGGFDLVVGNPPYVDGGSMTRYAPTLRAYCTERYTTARGNWDLFCVFIERALELQREGGVQSLLVPNKLASAEYARGLRQLMGQHHLEKLEDLSALRVFATDSYPIAFVLRKRSADERSSGDALLETPRAALVATSAPIAESQSDGRPRCELGAPWPLDEAGAPRGTEAGGRVAARIIAARERYQKLDMPHVDVSGGATVSEAYSLRSELREALVDDVTMLRVVNSGTIDRYECHWGRTAMRYLKATFLRPVVSEAALEVLSPRRLHQARSAKCIVAGLTRGLEVFPDLEGRYLAAKSTTIAVPRAPELSTEYLTAVLNSSLLSRIYAQLYGGLRLGGRYLRVGPPQLRCVPLVVPATDRERRLVGALCALARDRVAESSATADSRRSVSRFGRPARPEHSASTVLRALDNRIDELVEALYAERLCPSS